MSNLLKIAMEDAVLEKDSEPKEEENVLIDSEKVYEDIQKDIEYIDTTAEVVESLESQVTALESIDITPELAREIKRIRKLAITTLGISKESAVAKVLMSEGVGWSKKTTVSKEANEVGFVGNHGNNHGKDEEIVDAEYEIKETPEEKGESAEKLTTVLRKMWWKIVDFVKGIIDKVKSFFKGIFSNLKTLGIKANKLKESIQKIKTNPDIDEKQKFTIDHKFTNKYKAWMYYVDATNYSSANKINQATAISDMVVAGAKSIFDKVRKGLTFTDKSQLDELNNNLYAIVKDTADKFRIKSNQSEGSTVYDLYTIADHKVQLVVPSDVKTGLDWINQVSVKKQDGAKVTNGKAAFIHVQVCNVQDLENIAKMSATAITALKHIEENANKDAKLITDLEREFKVAIDRSDANKYNKEIVKSLLKAHILLSKLTTINVNVASLAYKGVNAQLNFANEVVKKFLNQESGSEEE